MTPREAIRAELTKSYPTSALLVLGLTEAVLDCLTAAGFEIVTKPQPLHPAFRGEYPAS